MTTEYRQTIWQNTSFISGQLLLCYLAERLLFQWNKLDFILLFTCRLETGMKPLPNNWVDKCICQFVVMLDTFQGSTLYMNWVQFWKVEKKDFSGAWLSCDVRVETVRKAYERCHDDTFTKSSIKIVPVAREATTSEKSINRDRCRRELST